MNNPKGGTGTTMPSVRSSRHSSGSVCYTRRVSPCSCLFGAELICDTVRNVSQTFMTARSCPFVQVP